MQRTDTTRQGHSRPAAPLRFSARIATILTIGLATTQVLCGCSGGTPASPHAATLAPNSVGDTTLHFDTNRKPVFAPGQECAAFTPELYRTAGVPQGIRATAMVPGHGCWAEGAHDNVISVMTTATPFGKFWRRNYPDDDGSGITATMVDKDSAQLFERFLIDNRYYAVRVGSQWAAGLDSGVTKTACMLVVDTGSAQPLLINATQQITTSDPAVETTAQQCTTAATIAQTVLNEHDPGGGSRVS
jgi:hypothetical protein